MDATKTTEAAPIEAPVQKTMDERPTCSIYNGNELKPLAKCFLCLPWSIWALLTTVSCCPLLTCTVCGFGERDSSGNPTYPIALAEMQCCEAMCCKCTKGY